MQWTKKKVIIEEEINEEQQFTELESIDQIYEIMENWDSSNFQPLSTSEFEGKKDLG
jgi:hypothetical protein